jgi:hypothetical protein
MVHAVCERCVEVERKRRSDARTTGVDTAIGLPGSTDITAFPESILSDDTGTIRLYYPY